MSTDTSKSRESTPAGEANVEFPNLIFHVNTNSWGPTAVPEQFVGVPFNPFNRSEKIGKAAELNSNDAIKSVHESGPTFRANVGKSGNPFGSSLGISLSRSQSSGIHGSSSSRYGGDGLDAGDMGAPANEGTFEIVGGSKARYNQSSSSGVLKGPTRRNRGGMSSGLDDMGADRSKQRRNTQNQSQGGSRFQSSQQRTRVIGSGTSRRNERENREPSVPIQDSWKLLEQFELSVFSKMAMNPPAASDIGVYGSLRRFNEEYDRLTVKSAKKLQRFADVNFVYVTTLDDPVIESLIESKQGNVFCTDELMSYLMTLPRSVLPWDIVFTRIENMLFIDKREDSNLELLTVNENSTITINEALAPYNEQEKLRIEATAINQNYLCQVLKSDKDEPPKTFENPNPFDVEEGEGKPSPIAYRYRKWNLGENVLIARTEIHGYVKRGENIDYANIYALNEWDARLSGTTEWRQKIDSQSSAIIATELRNNSAKIARWTAQSLLSGAELMKIGFVSRAAPNNPTTHQILKSQLYNPKEFSNQIGLTANNMWGIFKSIVDFMMSRPEGKYILLRDPNKPSVRIFSIPMDSFESSE